VRRAGADPHREDSSSGTVNVLTDRSRRGGRRRLSALLVVAALVPVGLLVWVATSSSATAQRGEPPPVSVVATTPAAGHVSTPLLSARRVPGMVTGELATRDLLAGLQQFAAGLPAPSCVTVAVDAAVVFDSNGAAPVLPASNMKLVVGAVALDKLGAGYRFTTSVVRGPDGTLYLVGGGDPVLSSQAYLDAASAVAARKSGSGTLEEAPSPIHTSIEQLADEVVAAGVKSVPAVAGDDSRYDHERFVPSWPASYATDLEAGPLGALMIDDAFATFTPKFTLAADPAEGAAVAFANLLRARGVTVGTTAAGTAPAGAPPVATIQSPPLSDILDEMLVTSDNNTAELLVKELGTAVSGQGTRAAGLQVVQQTLAAWGVPTDGLTLVDGSGLDRGDRLTCHALLGVMDHNGATGPLASALPVANQTGTLAPYFAGNPLAGVLHAKTGTLTGAKALTGYVPVDGGHTLTFSFVYNGANAEKNAPAMYDALGRALASYPYKPDLSAFVPAPPVVGA
jgi:D-alanyl-D-alanine carboxypeptidase/D-alanyl-D-alanine-endopeptidase (penicillin-binding protein 4)